MDWHFYSPNALETWDWRNPDSKGIGNSETSHIEMACRLAARGHRVTSYTKRPPNTPKHGGVKWRQLSSARFKKPGIWVLYRCPHILDRFPRRKSKRQQIWLMMQDTYYDAIKGRSDKIDKVLVLCEEQRKHIVEKHPELKRKMIVTSNGVRAEMIAEVESRFPYCPVCRTPLGQKPDRLSPHAKPGVICINKACKQYAKYQRVEAITRNPHRVHFSSSPDRGLKVLLESIFPRVREYVPDLEIHIYYGWNNILKLMRMGDKQQRADSREYFKGNMEDTIRLMNQPGVVWHGRIGQRELTKEWLKAGLWVFPSMYPETSCATAMEAMACGAIPICQAVWALGENVKYGSVLSGDSYQDPLVISRFVAEVVRWATQPHQQDHVRREMMPWARREFGWEKWVDQWERLIGLKPGALLKKVSE